MEDTMIKYTATAAALGLALIATPAMAYDIPARSTAIEYRDLNLSTPEGQDTLKRRINSAARQVCKVSRVQTGTRVKSRGQSECLKHARKSATKQVAAMISEARRGG